MGAYRLQKEFPSIAKAFDEILEMSRALSHSKLKLFKGCNDIDDIESVLRRNKKIAVFWESKDGNFELIFKTNKNGFYLTLDDGTLTAAWVAESDKGIAESSAVRDALLKDWKLVGFNPIQPEIGLDDTLASIIKDR